MWCGGDPIFIYNYFCINTATDEKYRDVLADGKLAS